MGAPPQLGEGNVVFVHAVNITEFVYTVNMTKPVHAVNITKSVSSYSKHD